MLVRYNSQNGFTGLLNPIKHLKNIPEITDDVKNALNNLNPPLIDNMKNMKTVGKITGSTNETYLKFLKGLKNGSITLQEGQTYLSAYQAYLQSTGNAFTVATIKAKVFTVAAKVLSSIGWMALITFGTTALMKGIEYLTVANERFMESQQDIIDKADETISKYDEEMSSLEDLQTKLEEAKNNKEELAKIQVELNEAIGATPGLLNGESDAWDIANQKITDRITRLKELKQEELDSKINAQKSIFNNRKIDNAWGWDYSFKHYANTEVDQFTFAALKENFDKYLDDSINSETITVQDIYENLKKNGYGEKDENGKGEKSDAEIFADIIDYTNNNWANPNASELQKYFNKQIATVQEIFDDLNIFDDLDSIFTTQELNAIITKLVEGGYAADLDGIQRVIEDMINQEDLSKLIDDYYESLFDNSIDSEALYEQLKTQFEELENQYPMLKSILQNVFNNIGTDIENTAKNISKTSTSSLFSYISIMKEKMDTLSSTTSSLSSALATLYSGDYDSTNLLSSISTINSAISDLGDNVSIDWENVASIDELQGELLKLSETYTSSMLSNAGININSPFAKMVQNSIRETVKLKAQLDGVNTALDNLQSNYKTLTDTIETYNEYGYITIDQLQSLLEMDDKYIACLIDENGQLSLNKTAYANLTKMQLENAKATALTEYESEVARIKQEALTRANQNLGASIGSQNSGLIGKLDSLSGHFTVLSGVISVAKNMFSKFKNAIDEFKSQAEINEDNIILDKQAEKELEDAEKAYNARLKLIGEVSDNLNSSMNKIMGNSSSSSTSSSDTVFDWIETRISRVQHLFQNMVDSVTSYVSKNFKLDTIDKELDNLNEQIYTYQLAAQRYIQEANRISISDDLRYKVINGEIDIQTFTDEDTIKAVNSFKEWYEKYLDAIDQVMNLENDKRDKIREKVDTRLSAIQSDRERLNVKAERKKDAIDYKEIIGGNAYSSEYQWLIKNSRQQYDSYQSENSVLKEYLSTLTKTSEEWEDIQKQIESNESSMRDLISSQTEWNHKIAQMPIEKAEKTIEKLSAKNEFINAKYENSGYVKHKQQMNKQLANNARLELKANQTAYTETKTNFYTASYNINHMTRDSLVTKVQKYTKAGKEIPSDILSLVYNSGNTLLIHRCSQYNAAYLARETAKDTYKLSKEQTKTELSELGQRNVEAVSTSFANKYTKVDNKKSYLDALKENTEANGKYVDSSYYKQMIAQVSKELSLKTNEQKKLQAIIDKNLQDGLWTTESQAYKDAVFQVEQLKTTIVELTTEQKNYNNALNQLPIDQIQTTLDILDGLANRDASKNSLKKAQGKDLSVADYQKELDNTQNQITKTLELRDKYYKKYMNAKSKGNQADADKYLQLYYEEDTALNNLKESYEELKDTMRDDVYWRSLERAHKAAQNLESTLSALSDLFSEDMFFDDNGSFTDMAVAKIGTLVKQYETVKEEVNNYTNDIENLNNLYKNGYYTQEEYKEKLAELQDGLLGAAGDVKTYTDSIIELYISQKDAELEALKELIDKRKEALNAKKAYYDYDKTIKDKTKDIKSLQSQIAALDGVETAEAKAQLAKYKSQLQEAQEDLESTKFEHKIELIVDGFDSLQTELQENHDEYVKNLKSSFDAQIDIIESANGVYAESYKQIIQSMTKMLEYYGVDTSTIKVKSLAGFAEGGIVRQVHKNGDKALVSVNPDETILTEKFTKVLPESVDIMSQFVNMRKLDFGQIVNIPTPDFNAIIPNVNHTPTVNIHYDNLLTVNGNVIDLEKATMDIVNHNMKTIVNGVSKDFSQQIRKMGFK